MNKLYVFAIGGSGSRVLRSLTMLMAAGVDSGYEIIPMIIDPDKSNGDLLRTADIMRTYQDISNQISSGNDTKNLFFANSISSLNGDGNFLLELSGTSGISFERYLGLSTMSTENQALMRMIFSNANLASDMNVGFKGNPNIGTIVLNQFVDSKEYKDFENAFQAGDKVFIISSIFGGTGASGFPLLLKNMRTSKVQHLKDAPIGAVTLLPYFNLQENSDSSIKADSFITKTKAALNYYEKNVTGNGSLEDMYYLGDDFSEPYENCDGGDGQLNKAHVIEMLAALAVVHFANKQHDAHSQAVKTSFHEFGLNGDPTEQIMFDDFGNETLDVIKKPLSMMTIMNLYLNNRDVAHRIAQKWAKEKDGALGDRFWSSNNFKVYEKFKKSFESWLREMQTNKKAFSPFNLDISDDVLEAINGTKPQYGLKFLFPKKGCDLIDKELGDSINSLSDNLTPIQIFMDLFYVTIGNIYEEKLRH